MAEAPSWTVAAQWEEHRSFKTATDAEAYAERLCNSVYAYIDETPHQLPFHVADEGDVWRVVGSRPYGWPTSVTGPLTIVIEKATGRVRDIHFTLAPAGWDKEILERLRSRSPSDGK